MSETSTNNDMKYARGSEWRKWSEREIVNKEQLV